MLIRQFRVATRVNGNPDGMLIEACAGLLDDDEPEVCIRKEAIEETGYRVNAAEKVFELYTSPAALPNSFICSSRNMTMPHARTKAAAWKMKR